MLAEIESESEIISDSDIGERLFALFPRDEWLYTMLSYFDESESARETLPAASISALTGTGLQWTKLSRGWLKVLEHPDYDVRDDKGRRVFHTCDFESPEGRLGTVYENWDEEKRKRFHRELCDVIVTSGIQISAASVLISDYEQVTAREITAVVADGQVVTAPLSRLFSDKYVYCAFFAMLFAADEAQLYYPKNTELSYTFESGGTYQHQVGLLYEEARKLVGNYFRFFEKPNFVDKGFAVPLQAADKIAYEASKHNSHMRDPNPPLKYAIVKDDGTHVWKTRYALEHFTVSGMELNLRYWLKEDIEAFFAYHDKRIVKRNAERAKQYGLPGFD
jgi:hypothetical protein